MTKQIKIIGENYPKVGDTFYWKDQEGEIHEETCFKIEQEDNPDLETMYFIQLSPNGGGTFVTESDIINPFSVEIEIYKKKKYKSKVKEIANMFNDDSFRRIIYKACEHRYGTEGGADFFEKIVELFGNEENYE